MIETLNDATRAPERIEIRPKPLIILCMILFVICALLLGVPVLRRSLDASEVVIFAVAMALGPAVIVVALRTRYIVVDDHALRYEPAGVSILFSDVATLLPPVFDSIERQREIQLEMKQASLRWYPLRYHSLGKTLHIGLFGVDKAALYRALETRLGKASE